MNKTPGPLIYEILKFSGIKTICLVEWISTTIQHKLRGNLAAFQTSLQKNYRSNRKSFDESKIWLKSLYHGESEDLGFHAYYTNGGSHGDYFLFWLSCWKEM